MLNKTQLIVFLFIITLVSCDKNDSRFYKDSQKNGLSIFSNNGNNLLTAFVNGNSWKTRDRITSGYTYRTDYEVSIVKQKTNTLKDTLIFSWAGPTTNSNISFPNSTFIALHIAVDSSFTYKDFKTTFSGKRIIIDSTFNGYFNSNLNTTSSRIKGNGIIYMHEAEINIYNSIFANNKIVGLLNAKIGNNNISDGRFDHSLADIPFNF